MTAIEKVPTRGLYPRLRMDCVMTDYVYESQNMTILFGIVAR